DGTVYAAAVGTRQSLAPAAPPPATAAQPTPAPAGQPAPAPLLTSVQPLSGGSEIYRIQTDGYPRRIWSHPQDVIYALALDSRGKLIAGGGNSGQLYRIDSDFSYTRLLDVEPTQITALAAAPEGKLYAVTGNIGKVFSVGPELEKSGRFESDVYD